MGRRKDRRLAALSAAGRRLKLDLVAEPSEDLGGSCAQGEVGGNDDTNNQAGLPNSPSSSDCRMAVVLGHSIGHQITPDPCHSELLNVLLSSSLLCPFLAASWRQRVCKDMIPHRNLGDFSGVDILSILYAGKQVENPLVLLGQYSDDELEDESSGEQKIAGDSCAIPVDDQEKLAAGQESEDIGIKEGNGPTADRIKQLAVENGPGLVDSLEKLEDDVGVGIHASDTGVLHDASGLTARVTADSTSYAQVVGESSSGWKIVLHEESNEYYYWNIATGETSWEVPSVLVQATEQRSYATDEQTQKDVSEVTNQNCGTAEGSVHVNEGYEGDVSDDNKWDHEGEALDDKKWDHGGASLDVPGTSPGTNVSPGQSDDVLPLDGNATNINLLKPGHIGCYATGTNLSSPCHGSSLLPFWEHSKRQLQVLEAVINDVFQELKSGPVNGVDTTSMVPESISDNVKANSAEEKAAYAVSDDFSSPDSAGIREFQKNNSQMDNNGATAAENIPSDRNPIAYPANPVGEKVEVELTMHQELTPKTLLQTGEEVDMDVDMEVEDADPPSNLTVSVPLEQFNLPTLITEPESSASLVPYNIPPLPDEDWIPPPPPDNEPFPPPPPDEPPEITYPQSSDLAPIQSFAYSEQYNLYPSSHFQYYAQGNTDAAASNLYAQTDECQLTISQTPLYFEASSEMYDPAMLAVNPIEPGLHYGLQDGISQPVSSEFHGDSVQNPTSDPTLSIEAQAAVGSASLPKAEVDVPAISGDANKASLAPSSSQAILQASAAISRTECVSDSSLPATTASVPASTTAPKVQSKVQRNKKRTVAVVSSLRSNKKVSSLVDKWKAAKEELQEEENEPENAYEILEKKRQREIEEWYAQQIASGEARDNANFQPLGGDWRERVKRKRARLAKESVQTPSEDVSEGNPQSDLDELSRGLPHGWQAYWDDSSKQVYYGHTFTSETTWTRPPK
ncbi:hypothetical protein ACH5RR_038106 [Cinchona calisaya]|uniref:WW domain-containing protein n=1 Tax=Cinchona calisaya TaxID=153742 RepID=A0ABD2YCS3_9GENT